MKILGIETSCDETAASIVENGTKVLSSVISSQIDIHSLYGGVVPEAAARNHVESIIPVIKSSFKKAKLKLTDIDAIAVTEGPGLIGSLVIGIETGKSLAWAMDIPIIPVNHLIGHIYANWLGKKKVNFPALCLLVSGGHTILLRINSHQEIIKIGQTLDDAAGEVFDKVAKILSLNYPGGPEISKLSENGDKEFFKFPRALITGKEKREQNYNFSFSGLKTAVLNTVKSESLTKKRKANIAASFQVAVIDQLLTKIEWYLETYPEIKTVMLAGGVAANNSLKQELLKRLITKKFTGNILWPEPILATDNATMIATAAYFNNKPQRPENISAFASGNDRLKKS